MYGIFELCGATLTKNRVFADKSFASFDEAKLFFASANTVFEVDPDGHDAADVFDGLTGNVYSVEPVK